MPPRPIIHTKELTVPANLTSLRLVKLNAPPQLPSQLALSQPLLLQSRSLQHLLQLTLALSPSCTILAVFTIQKTSLVHADLLWTMVHSQLAMVTTTQELSTTSLRTPGIPPGVIRVTSTSSEMEMVMVLAASRWTHPVLPLTDLNTNHQTA